MGHHVYKHRIVKNNSSLLHFNKYTSLLSPTQKDPSSYLILTKSLNVFLLLVLFDYFAFNNIKGQ